MKQLKKSGLDNFSLQLEAFVVGVILAIAFILRFTNLHLLTVFTYDQGRDLVEVRKIAEGDFTLVGPTTGIPGVFVGPFHFYALLPGYLLGQGSPIVVAYWTALVSWLSLISVYLILRYLFPVKFALIGFLIVTITMGSIDLARTIWNPSWTIPILSTATALLFFSLNNKSQWLLIPTWFLVGLSLQTELIYTIFVVPVFGWWLLKKRTQYPLLIIVLSLLAFLITFIPQIIFELRNDFIMSKSLIANMQDQTQQGTWIKVLTEKPPAMWSELRRTLFGYMELSTWFVGAIFIFSLILVRQRKNLSVEQKFFLLWWFIPLVGLTLLRGNKGQFFSYYLTPHFFPGVMITLFAVHTFSFLQKIKWYFIVLYVFLCLQALENYYNPQLYQYNLGRQIDALMYPRTAHTMENYAIDVSVPNLMPINYEYVNWWLSKKQPVHFGITDEHQEYFLIYEPGGELSEFTLQPWLESRKHNTNCFEKEHFGIITVERCVKK